jgi:hypothetical protein
MIYPVAEKFRCPQGEGLYTGTPSAFVRLVGCSVGHKVCTSCDTQFDRTYPHLGGGMDSVEDLNKWVGPYRHVVVTGGEPLDRDLRPLIFGMPNVLCHVETSGTVHPRWLGPEPAQQGCHFIGDLQWPVWITVSPKPGYLQSMLRIADELKIIIGGLGDGPGWPTVDDAVRWAEERPDLPVYIQPKNSALDIDPFAMREALKLVDEHPNLRLSAQWHKYLRVR